MQFLKVLFWCLLAFFLAIFTNGNWTVVSIRLWNGLVADVKLPLLLAVTFLLGFLPTLLWHQLHSWRTRQRMAMNERALADLRASRQKQGSVFSPSTIPMDHSPAS